MAEFKHWCGNCQIRIYIQRHYGKDLNWHDCPYTCEYKIAIGGCCSTETDAFARDIDVPNNMNEVSE